MVCSVKCYALTLLITKVIQIIDKNFNPFIMCAVRCAFSLTCLIPLGFYQTQGNIYTGLTEPYKNLKFSTFVVAFTGQIWEIMVVFICVGQMPFVIVAIFLSCGPLLTVVLAVPMQGEKFSLMNVLLAVVGFTGVIMIVLG